MKITGLKVFHINPAQGVDDDDFSSRLGCT